MSVEWEEVARFWIAGEPKGQPRHRVRIMWKPVTAAVRASLAARRMLWAVVRSPRSGTLLTPTAQMYDSDTADDWKAAVRHAAIRNAPAEMITGPIRVDINWYFPRPKHLMRQRDPDGPVEHGVKPDRDNCDKLILDVMTSTERWWKDDARVCGGYLMKWYHGKGKPPGAWVRVCRVKSDQAALFAEAAEVSA